MMMMMINDRKDKKKNKKETKKSGPLTIGVTGDAGTGWWDIGSVEHFLHGEDRGTNHVSGVRGER